MKLWPYCFVLPLFILGCKTIKPMAGSETLAAKSQKSSSTQACAKQQDANDNLGQPLILCQELYPERPYVRPEPDDLKNAGAVTFAAGLHISPFFKGGVFFIDRNGTKYRLVDKQGENVDFATPGALPAAMQAPTNSYLNKIYKVTGKIGKAVKDAAYGSVKTIQVTDANPMIAIDGCMMDSFLLGIWEGTASRRLLASTGHYPFLKSFDDTHQEPIQVTLTKAKYTWNLMDWFGSKTTDIAVYKLTGTLDNLMTDVQTKAGKTLPALARLGDESPFLGATDNAVELYRQTNMHGIGFDNHWVLTYPSGAKDLTINGMTLTIDFLTPPAFIAVKEPQDDIFAQLSIVPHPPFNQNGHIVTLVPKNIGQHVGACEK